MQQELPQKRGWGAADVQLSLYSLGEKTHGNYSLGWTAGSSKAPGLGPGPNPKPEHSLTRDPCASSAGRRRPQPPCGKISQPASTDH